VLNAEQLHELRLAAGVSIYTLAERAGVHWQTVLSAERGCNLKAMTRQRLEAALDAVVEERAILVATARWLMASAA
jgi:predicted transcriptional regulator